MLLSAVVFWEFLGYFKFFWGSLAYFLGALIFFATVFSQTIIVSRYDKILISFF